MLYCKHRNKVAFGNDHLNKLIHYFSEVISPPHKLRFITSVMERSNTMCEKREQTPATVSFFYPAPHPQPPGGRFFMFWGARGDEVSDEPPRHEKIVPAKPALREWGGSGSN